MPDREANRIDIVIRGKSVVELPREKSDLKFTHGTRRTFKGDKQDILDLYDDLTWQGYQCIVKEGPLYQLDATIGGFIGADDQNLDLNQVPDAQWEFLVSKTNKDLLESDAPIVQFLDPVHMKALKEWAKNDSAGSIPAFDYYCGRGYDNDFEATTQETAYFISQFEQAWRIYLLLATGVKDIEVRLVTLRKTIQPPVGYDYSQIVDGDDVLISTDRLFASSDALGEGAPEWLNLKVGYFPTDKYVYPDNLPEGTPKPDKTYGWLKRVLSINESAEGRLSIVIEYYYDIWAMDIYGEVQGPGNIAA